MGNALSIEEEEPEDGQLFAAWKEAQHSHNNCTEPLNLTGLPREVLNRVINKLDYVDYAKLEETSRSLHDTCNMWKFALPYFVPSIYVNKKTVKISSEYCYYENEVPQVPWQVAASQSARIRADAININHRATSGRIQAVAKLFEKNQTQAEVLTFTEHIQFQAEDLARLIKATKVRHLDSRQFLPREFFQSPAFQNLSSITLHTCGCTDEEICHLKMDYIYMINDFITARGLNRFLKQWKKGDREISVVDIEFDSSWNTRNFDAILEGLDANTIWTPATHADSIIAPIPLEDYYPMKTGDPEHLYSIFRSDDIENIRLIRLRQGRFEIFYVGSENNFLLSYLDDDQYYAVTGRCMCCEMEFCEHRRRLSSQRFKKAFPTIYSGVISAFQMAGVVALAARGWQLVQGGSQVPVQPITSKQLEQLLHEELPIGRWREFLFDLRVLLFNV